MEKIKEINNDLYIVDQKAWEIGEAVLKGILLEVTSYPKPGLVSSISMGSHTDMNILTFMVSSASIAPAFYKSAYAGLYHKGNIDTLFSEIRKIGLYYEKKLLDSTKGINTQKGILFSGCILSAAAGYLLQNTIEIKSKNLFFLISEMTQGLVSLELEKLNYNKKNLTAGEQIYRSYKVTGIRGEVEDGFPSVRNIGLPAFKIALRRKVKLNYCIIHTLISLMTCVNDTNILWRKDMSVLKEVQNLAKDILNSGSVFTKTGLDKIYKLDNYFIENNISPGGSADLVSITIATYLLENKQFPVEIL